MKTLLSQERERRNVKLLGEITEDKDLVNKEYVDGKLIGNRSWEDVTEYFDWMNGWSPYNGQDGAFKIYWDGFVVIMQGLVTTGTVAVNTPILRWRRFTPIEPICQYSYAISCRLGNNANSRINYIPMARTDTTLGQYVTRVDNNISFGEPKGTGVTMFGITFAKDRS